MKVPEIPLEALEREHEELRFENFSPQLAYQIGTSIKEEAEEHGLAVAIDICLNGHQLFHCALDGTSPDNDRWIKRKNNVVNHFGKSSLYIKHLLLENKKSLSEMFFLDPGDYATFGGSFPILITGSGAVGTITVSGLPDEEDHKLVISHIRKFL